MYVCGGGGGGGARVRMCTCGVYVCVCLCVVCVCGVCVCVCVWCVCVCGVCVFVYVCVYFRTGRPLCHHYSYVYVWWCGVFQARLKRYKCKDMCRGELGQRDVHVCGGERDMYVWWCGVFQARSATSARRCAR